MANDIKKLSIGGSVVSVGDWVSGGTGATLTDVGILKEGSEFTDSTELYEAKFESVEGAALAVPTESNIELKCVMAETDLEKLQWILHQPAGNLTGTAPNRILRRGTAEEQYKQVKIETKGICGPNGTRATRTLTLYRCVVKKLGAIKLSKKAEQLYEVTFGVLYDTTVSGGTYYQVADTGAA